MAENEANDYLENYTSEIFGNKCHSYTNYAAVIEHPGKPKEFAIEVGAEDLKTFYIDNYLLECKINELKDFGFNASLIAKMNEIDKSKDSQRIGDPMKK